MKEMGGFVPVGIDGWFPELDARPPVDLEQALIDAIASQEQVAKQTPMPIIVEYYY